MIETINFINKYCRYENDKLINLITPNKDNVKEYSVVAFKRNKKVINTHLSNRNEMVVIYNNKQKCKRIITIDSNTTYLSYEKISFNDNFIYIYKREKNENQFLKSIFILTFDSNHKLINKNERKILNYGGVKV